MSEDWQRLLRTFRRIDELHRDDPVSIPHQGREVARELFYSWRMSTWRRHFHPNSSVALRIAVRAQHLCRWEVPRDAYPVGRAGYLRWRRERARSAASRMSEILTAEGWTTDLIRRVGELIRKEHLTHDVEALALEDCAAMVFLELDYQNFASGRDPAEVERILHRTLDKMSVAGARRARRWLAES